MCAVPPGLGLSRDGIFFQPLVGDEVRILLGAPLTRGLVKGRSGVAGPHTEVLGARPEELPR